MDGGAGGGFGSFSMEGGTDLGVLGASGGMERGNSSTYHG